MPRPIMPDPHFAGLSEDTVRRALRDARPGNIVAREVARLIAGYTDLIPADFLHVAPGSLGGSPFVSEIRTVESRTIDRPATTAAGVKR